MPFVGANATPARFWRVWPNRIKLGGRFYDPIPKATQKELPSYSFENVSMRPSS